MPSHEMMRSYLDLVTSGKIVEAEAYYTDDVKIHVRGNYVGSGDYEGLADYNAALGRIMGQFDEMTVEAHDLLVSDDHAVTLSVWHVRKGDRTEALNHCIVYHTEGDKISELWIIPEDPDKDAELLS